jgi:nitrate/TMAO reductase-like tetraheme cytochrome c subunit
MQVIRKYKASMIICCALIVVGSFAIVHAQDKPPSQDKAADVPRMPTNHFLFATSAHCISCHSQVHAPDGEDISIGTQWRASVMANSSRDPYWQASIRRETIDHPTATAAIEDKCSTCHMPMQRYQARAEGLRGEVMRYLTAVSSGAALGEPEGELENAKSPKATLAADGVSCTVCHQVQNSNLGQRSSLDGGFLIDVTRKDEEREIFGPFDDPDKGRQRLMHSATGFTPKKVDYLGDSALCASCHTLLTDALDDHGKPAGTLPEQMPYQEWQHSDYAKTSTCQDCHMTQVKGEAPITSIHAQDHDGVMRHIFVGGNATLLRMLKDHAGELGVTATGEELEASAGRSEAMLAHDTATVTVEKVNQEGERLNFDVAVTNRTGHKLPTAYPARRAWLHVTVRDARGAAVFESGAVRPDGSIVGNDNDADGAKFEPHYSRITQPDQVEIYESIMGDFKNRVTTGLLYGTHYLKDNRILPKGFNKQTADSGIAVVGAARSDRRFTGGAHAVNYSVALSGSGPYRISAELLYESIGYRWAHNLEPYEASEPKRFLGYYKAQAPSLAKLLANSTFDGPRHAAGKAEK